MAQIGHALFGEGALGPFEHQAVLTQCRENDADVLKMFAPCLAVDQNVVEEDKNEPAQVGTKYLVH